MDKKKGGVLDLGIYGFGIVILSFFSCYLYSALTSDSLNVTVGVFGGLGLDTNILYALSSVATVLGVVGSVVVGRISQGRIRRTWAAAMILVGIFALIWSRAASAASSGNTGAGLAFYAVGYLVCYTLALVSAMLLGFNTIANWFPHKRGVALGIAIAGFPLSAATTTAVCSFFASDIGNFYVVYGIIAILVGVGVFFIVRDFPEERGCYPDNNKDFDAEAAKKEHEESLEYLKTSKWTLGKVIKTLRTWQITIAISTCGFLCMGIMSNFLGKFLEQGYDQGTILTMLAVVGIVAIPGSVFVGWLDVNIGTRKTALIVGLLAVLATGFNIPNISILHYISLPLLAVMVGGANNMLTSVTAACWGRYDFQNAFRVTQPLNALMSGLGITVVGIVGTNFGYLTAYKMMFVMAIIAFIVNITMKVEPIDKDVR